MPWKIQSTKANRTTTVQVSLKGRSRVVDLRGRMVAYSDDRTQDIITQVKCRYITCVHVDRIPEDETIPDMGQGALLAAVDQRDAEVTGEAASEEERYFTEEEILSLKKSQLVELTQLHPEFELHSKMNKADLQTALLAEVIPWVNL